MALIAPIVDGKVPDTGTTVEKKTNSNEMGKDAFLQLLVAQMKYQDPLEPTSNTEYVAQLATFSQLEATQNTTASMDIQRASSLIGKDVIMSVRNASTGDVNYVQGRVDSMEMNNGKPYLNIMGNLYDASDVVSVIDDGYLDAGEAARGLVDKVSKLPKLINIEDTDMEALIEVETIWNNMNDYEKSFIEESTTETIKEYIEKLDELREEAEPEPETPVEPEGEV